MNKKSSKTHRKLSRRSKKSRPKISLSSPKKLRLFIDPASISSGWALFRDKQFLQSGTVLIEKKLPPFERCKLVYLRYLEIATELMGQQIEEVHIEQLPRSCHIYTHYSVCAAGIAFAARGCSVAGDIPIQSWQKMVDWNGERKALETYKVSSEDELAAIGMGLYYVGNI